MNSSSASGQRHDHTASSADEPTALSANSKLTMAVHALCWLELAGRRGAPSLTSERIAASLASHPVAVRRCLGQLRNAHLVQSARGSGLGWSLTRPADQITVLDVHQAIGGEEFFALHPHEPNQECPVGFGIQPVLRNVYQHVQQGVTAELSQWTIAALLDDILAIPDSPELSTFALGRRAQPPE